MITNPFVISVLRIGIRTNIFILSLLAYGNPARAIKALKLMISLRTPDNKLGKVNKFVLNNGKIYLALNIPGWPSSGFNSFIKNEFLRNNGSSKMHLQSVFLELTANCPLNCIHCSFGDKDGTTNSYKPEILHNILAKIKEAGLRHVQFTGGEPMECKETLLALVKASRGMDTWILTSGFGLSIGYARMLKDAGLKGLNISLDHWDEAKHNKNRGNNTSFQRVREAVEYSLKSGLLVSISLCATRDFTTRENLERLIELITSWKVHFLRILEPKASGRFINKDIRLRPDQLLILEEVYISYNAENSNKNTPIIMYPDYFNRGKCIGKGDRYLYIDGDGIVHPCPFSFTGDKNILKQSLQSIVDDLSAKKCIECNLPVPGIDQVKLISTLQS